MSAIEIAASIDVSTVAGHNLRALLLRLLDGEDELDENSVNWCSEYDAEFDAIGRGLAVSPVGAGCLTPLGRGVGELLRPTPWRVTMHNDGRSGVAIGKGIATVRCELKSDAERIAALLTADDLRAAKAYRSEP